MTEAISATPAKLPSTVKTNYAFGEIAPNPLLEEKPLLPFLAPPSVEKLIDFGSTDLLEFYRAMTSPAVQLSQAYGDLFHKEMSDALQLSS